MSTTEMVEPIKVGDERFLVASTIERCPKTMMLRELFMNAAEAAALAPERRRVIEISALEVNGVSKLAIWNTGPGMDAQELYSACDLAASIRKSKSLDANFGMGAKVASLPSNQHGLRYRSCKDGKVHEVILCKRDNVYGRLRRFDPETSAYIEIADVTEIVGLEGRDIDEDWTEVVLLGNAPDQNTVKDPFHDDPAVDVQWIATYLYHRFYRLPDGVRVSLLKGTNKLDDARQFEPIPRRLRFFERHESVDVGSAVRIHYLYDAPYDKGAGHNKSISGAIASAVSTCGIVFKDELYDVRKGRDWTFTAPIFGVPFGARHISVHVELPAAFKARPEGYRQFLRYVDGEQAQVSVEHFAQLVRDNRPQWLIDVIRSFSPESAAHEDVRAELQKLLNDLRVQRRSPKTSINGKINLSAGTGIAVEPTRGSSGDGGGSSAATGSSRQRHTNLSVLPSGARRADIYPNMERAPDIKPLRTEQEIEEKKIRGRAARYYQETNELFVNMTYPAFSQMKEILEQEYAGAPDLDAMRDLAENATEKTIFLRVGRAVIFALAKQLNREWDRQAVDTALSPESLSLAADDFSDALQSARRRIGKALRMTRQSVDRIDPEFAT